MTRNIKPAIITFPGSNCERDSARVLSDVYHLHPQFIWHEQPTIPSDITHVILPGGFSFGDYLRAGALAALAPVMTAVRDFALSGMPVLGICNGFQILCEAKLLPGILMRNHHDRFVCKTIPTTWYGRQKSLSRSLLLPVAHRDGRFVADEKTLRLLRDHHQIMLTYDECDQDGKACINGSVLGIAGIIGGPRRNIMGLMPHPERAIFLPLGDAGRVILDEFLYGDRHEA
jgi:phosphoribosylformylglycinamidine synthase